MAGYTHADAAGLIERMTSAETEPKLTMQDIDLLLVTHRVEDRFGVSPADAGWEPTWDLNSAASEGWRWKAAKIADRFGFSADGATYNRDQQYQHCMDMARMYSSRVVRSIDTSPYPDNFDIGDLIP